MIDVLRTNHELRVCNACGHENVRERRERHGELPCVCGCQSFTLYDALWVARREGYGGDIDENPHRIDVIR